MKRYLSFFLVLIFSLTILCPAAYSQENNEPVAPNNNLGGAVGGAIGTAVGGAFGGALGGAVGGTVGNLGGKFIGSLGGSKVGNNLGSNLGTTPQNGNSTNPPVDTQTSTPSANYVVDATPAQEISGTAGTAQEGQPSQDTESSSNSNSGLLGIQSDTVSGEAEETSDTESGEAAPADGRPTAISSLSELPPETLEKIPPELREEIETMLIRSNEFRQQFNDYLHLQDKVATANFATLNQMAADNMVREHGPIGSFISDYSKMDVIDKHRMQTMTSEWLAGVHQDLSVGRTGQIINPADFPGDIPFGEIRSQFEVNRYLQDNDIPQEFGDHSPSNLAELRSLQSLNRGNMPQVGDDTGYGALSRHFENMSDKRSDLEMEVIFKNQRVPQGLGVNDALPNATYLPENRESIIAEQNRINAQLGEMGIGPIASSDLNYADDQKQQFLEAVRTNGTQFYERLGGKTDSPFFTLGMDNAETRESMRSQLNGAEVDQLVAIQDSRQLLRGNQSQLHLEDVPMSNNVRTALGFVGPSPQALPDTYGYDGFQMPDIFRTPEQRIPQMEQIDRAALVPAEHRKDYLQRLDSKIFNESLDQRSKTELIAEFDNTLLNRAAEALDIFSYTKNPRDWIGPTAERRTFQSQTLGEKVDNLTEKASTDSIYDRHGAAIQNLRQSVYPLEYHQNLNYQYEQEHQSNEARTGLTIATLPLTFMGAAGPAARGTKRLAQGSKRLFTSTVNRMRNLSPTLSRGVKSSSTLLRNGSAIRQTQTLTNIGRTTNNFTDDVFRAGQKVTVRRSSGLIESNWQIKNVASNGNVIVQQPGTNLVKQVRASDMIAHNPALIRTGQTVAVQRSSGAIESGWQVLKNNGTHIRVTRNGLIKDIPADDLVRLNHGTSYSPPVKPANVSGIARNQSLSFNQNHRIGAGEKITDGFVDGGRGMKVGSNGSASSSREVLVVDRARDVNLQKHIQYANSLQKLPEAERARKLAQYVDDVMNPQGGRYMSEQASRQMVNRYAGNEVLIGDVPNIGGGGGVCRHRSILYKILGDEAGLNTSLVRGNMATRSGVGGHAWNEVRLANGQTLVVDVMNPKPNFYLPNTSEVGSRYLTVGNKVMYGVH